MRRGVLRPAPGALAAPACAIGCALLATALALAGCGGSQAPKSLDVARVAKAIEVSIQHQRHLQATVICPPKVLQKPGRFACVATTLTRGKSHREVKTPFLVTIHNDKGWVSYVGEKPFPTAGAPPTAGSVGSTGSTPAKTPK